MNIESYQSEAYERAIKLVNANKDGSKKFKNFDAASAFVRSHMPDSTTQVIDNVAEVVYTITNR